MADELGDFCLDEQGGLTGCVVWQALISNERLGNLGNFVGLAIFLIIFGAWSFVRILLIELLEYLELDLES